MIIALRSFLAPEDRIARGVISTILLAAIVTISLVPPENIPLSGCAFHSLTGYSCLTCGMTRALHAITHGHLVTSLRYHVMGPVIFAGGVLLFLMCAAEAVTGRRLKIPLRKGTGGRICVLLGVLWLSHWVRSWLGGPINVRLRELRLADAGIKESDVKDLFCWVSVEGLGLVSVDKVTGEIGGARSANPIEALVIPIVIMLLMLMMIMMSVPGMLHSVMEEKTQRIAEVLLGSLKPFEFMIGKVIGGIAVALTSSLVYIVGAAIAVQYMGYTEYVPLHILPWFFAFMLLAVIMFGAWSAALGATCSEAKDAQSLTFPSIIPALFPIFIYFPVAKEPMGSFAMTMSLIPPFTPLLMALRMGTPGSVPAWQPWAGLAGVLVFTVLMVWIGGRIFRAAILLQGTPPKLSNIVKWAVRG